MQLQTVTRYFHRQGREGVLMPGGDCPVQPEKAAFMVPVIKS